MLHEATVGSTHEYPGAERELVLVHVQAWSRVAIFIPWNLWEDSISGGAASDAMNGVPP